MFRRKEDSLFDNTTDPNQEPKETSSASADKKSSASNASPSASAKGAPSQGANASAPSSPSNNGQNMSSRPTPPASNSANNTNTNSGFRSASNSGSAPLSADMGRNRMPEVGGKPQSPAMPSSSGPIPSPMAPGTPATETAAQASANSAKQAGKRVLTVGNDILLKGEIATCDRLVIEGKVDATLNDVHTVEIAENGSFKGSASIEDAEISGLFEGDLVVRNRLVIYGTGQVRGNITYGEIQIERGGELTGAIKSSASPDADASLGRGRKKTKEKEAA